MAPSPIARRLTGLAAGCTLLVCATAVAQPRPEPRPGTVPGTDAPALVTENLDNGARVLDGSAAPPARPAPETAADAGAAPPAAAAQESAAPDEAASAITDTGQAAQAEDGAPWPPAGMEVLDNGAQVLDGTAPPPARPATGTGEPAPGADSAVAPTGAAPLASEVLDNGAAVLDGSAPPPARPGSADSDPDSVPLAAAPPVAPVTPAPTGPAAPIRGKATATGADAPGLVEPEPTPPGGVPGTPGTPDLRALCGNTGILGRAEEPIPTNTRGCGMSAPVRVFEVAGIRLDPPALIDCPTAIALNEWVRRGARPALRDLGGGLDSLRIGSSYACPVDLGPPEQRLHLHTVGKAIDVSGFGLRDGSRISVFGGWDSAAWGAPLGNAAESACDIFAVVLSPAAEGGQRNAIHLDTGRFAAGPFCR